MGQAYNHLSKHTVENIERFYDSQVSDDFIKAHLQEENIYFEINKKLLNKAMLFVRHGAGYKQVIWTKYENQLLLQIPRIASLAGTIIPVNNNPKILANTIGIFPIIKEKSNSNTFYIEVTDLFLKNTVAWQQGFKETVISNLTGIHSVNCLENEIIIQTDRGISKKNINQILSVDFSFFLLPTPMKPRLFDYRIGYTVEDEFSAINRHPKNAKASISRWRLEKKDQSKKISAPIKPMTFYLDSSIPKKWKPYVTTGILKWLPAFEAAGFKNAIQIKEVPANDKNWAVNSVNHSIVRWVSKENIRGAEKGAGSTVSKIVDFRSGEILKSDIIIGTSYEYLSDNYFVRCSPMDKRAQQYPFPDDLMGELIQCVVSHEAGHAFGIKDANFGEYAYPFAKMRDMHWLTKMGHTPSIMNYTRHNYIAQPEDQIPPSLLIQKVGPTDIYNIIWGYKPFSNSDDPMEELPYLEKIIRQQDTVRWFRYTISNREKIGPAFSNQVADNNNPIQSTTLGLKNLRRVMDLLPKVTKTEKDPRLLERLYNQTLELWFNEMSHVLMLVGGYTVYYKSADQKGNTYTKIPKAIQKEALDFLVNNAFDRPDWLTNPKITDRFQYTVSFDKITFYQLKLLSDLLNAARLKRLERMAYAPAYSKIMETLFASLRKGLWKELDKDTVEIEAYRQELQNFYIATLRKGITKPKKYMAISQNDKFYKHTDYTRSSFMSELRMLKKKITENSSKAKDATTYGHLKLCLRQMDSVLNTEK
ncbi:zinc-dependent metalloprotease [uncultured Polaribacter sp.]|uniref:zinc-dependent metalloprotease n=1 Tax=uncultured Polaribacter sp. TaxID=174711 RepID=UPI0026388EF8|nr:zinc-dependent metalloprotease [uncultured Polaribacter sp.]